MCLGIAGQVIEFLPQSPDLARVDVFGAERIINVGLIEKDGLAPGEWVLIHIGFAIAKMSEAEARASIKFLETMAQPFVADEAAAKLESEELSAAPAQPMRKRAP